MSERRATAKKPAAGAKAAGRGPQQARSRSTRARLVEAAGRCLVELGYAGTSTATVALTAGVSHGALFKHFPSKARLLGACVADILQTFVEAFRRDVRRRLGGSRRSLHERLGPAVAALWAIFRRPEMRAVFEVYVAARTDAALDGELGPLLSAHRGSILTEARALFAEAADHPEFEAVIDAVVYAMQGAVLGLFAPDAAADARHLAFFERLARRELEHLMESEGGLRQGPPARET